MLVDTLRQKTGVRINVATMSIALKTIGARRGRPKPTVKCPWSKPAKDRRFREIQQLIEQLPPDEVAVYEDEVDIPLNPKIGLDWMVTGQQKEVVTPGKNQKSYLAGAQDVRTCGRAKSSGSRGTRRKAFSSSACCGNCCNAIPTPKPFMSFWTTTASIPRSKSPPAWQLPRGSESNCTFCHLTVPITTRSSGLGRICMTTSLATTAAPTCAASSARFARISDDATRVNSILPNAPLPDLRHVRELRTAI